MNFKGFKKISDDEHKTILRNEKGHSITLAKKGLSKGHLDGISKLPLHAYMGTDTEGQAAPAPQPESEISPEEAQQAQMAQDTGQLATGVDVAQPPPVEAEVPQQPAVASDQNIPGVTAPPEAAPVAPPQQQNPMSFPDSIAGEMQKVQVDIANNHLNPKTYSDLLWKDKNGEEKSSWGKLTSLFGLLLSGAGSGLAHQESSVMKMMDNTIKNDLDAQKTEQTNKNTFYGALSNAHHMATADTVTKDAYMQAYGRRMSLNALYNDVIKKIPEGSPLRMRSEQSFGRLVMAADRSDVGADAQIHGMMQVYGGAGGMRGGPLSRGQGQGQPGTAQRAPAKPMPISQAKWDSGVNEGALDKMILDSKIIDSKGRHLPDVPSETEVGKMMEEKAEIQELREERKAYVDSFNKLDKMLFGGKLNPTLEANYKNALNASIARIVAHRFVSGEAKSQEKGIFPDPLDVGGMGGMTRQEKLRKGLEIFDKTERGHSAYLSQYGALTKPPSVILDSVHNKQYVPPKGKTGFDSKGNPVISDGTGWVRVKK